ncbi:class I SAM-dependent methyltransferase [Fusibacter bizertensis]
MNEDINKNAWEQEHVSAWVERFGLPETYALKLTANPHGPILNLESYFGTIAGKNILNVMGSNGNKAVALSLLGAHVTVVDFSESNRQYALALAREAGVKIDYILCDILKFDAFDKYDLAFAEMGILHYFLNLEAFYKVLYLALKQGGELVIRDFHPVSTKLISSRGSTAKVRKHKVEGDYFDSSLVEKTVSYGKYISEEENENVEKVYLRNWTLGEIVTSAVNVGFKVVCLIEEPNKSSEVYDKGIPKTFILKLIK